MSNLPPKPEFTRTPSTWPEPIDERRHGGGGRLTPPSERYAHARDDRDRTHRARYPVRRSPPPRTMDSYVAPSDAYRDDNNNNSSGNSSREYRGGYDDYRGRDDRRRDWERGHHDRRPTGRMEGDAWVARNEYGSRNERASVGGRRTYDGPVHEYRRDWARTRDYAYEDRRDRYERRESPGFRGGPLSPRREYYGRAHTPPRRPQPTYPPRGRRSTSPRSIDDRSRRSPSLRPSIKTEVADHPSPGGFPRPAHRSPSPPPKHGRYSRSASPRRQSPPISSPTHPQIKAEAQEVDIKRPSHSDLDILSPTSGKFKDASIDRDSLVPEGLVKDEVEPSNSPGSERQKGKDRSENRKGTVDVVMRSPSSQQGGPRSPLDRSRPLVQSHPNANASTSPEPSKPAPTLPYLPTIPKYEPRPKFSSVYETELNRIEAHRAHAAAECRKSWKASRRALHELEMATLDLRAAQHRRELAESHRKRAHHGQLGINPEVGQ